MLMSFVCICLCFASLCGCCWYWCCCCRCCCCVCCCCTLASTVPPLQVCVCVRSLSLLFRLCWRKHTLSTVIHIHRIQLGRRQRNREKDEREGEQSFTFVKKIGLRVNCDQQLLLKNHSVWTRQAFCRPHVTNQSAIFRLENTIDRPYRLLKRNYFVCILTTLPSDEFVD